MALALSVIFFPAFYGNMLIMVIGLILIAEAVGDLSTICILSRYAQR